MPLAYLRQVEKSGGERRANATASSIPATPEQRPRVAPIRVFGVSPFKAALIALIAMVALPVVVYLPWIISMLSPAPNFPHFWVRPSVSASVNSPLHRGSTGTDGEVGDPRCFSKRAQVADPYRRQASEFGGWDRDVQSSDFCEDAEILHSQGLVFLSCDPGRREWNTVMGPLKNPKPRGALWVYDYRSSSLNVSSAGPEIVQLLHYPDRFDFHPLGISIWQEAKQSTTGAAAAATAERGRALRLFVVNHQRARSTVDVFDLEKREHGWVASYLRSIVDPLATHTPNSIQALSATSFLVTNDHLFARRMPPSSQLSQTFSHALPLPTLLSRLLSPLISRLVTARPISTTLAVLETFFGLPLSWVSYVSFDSTLASAATSTATAELAIDQLEGQEARDAFTASHGVTASIVASRIPFANGIALSPDSTTLVVASSTYPGVYLYDVGPPPPPVSTRQLKGTLGIESRFSPAAAEPNLARTRSKLNWHDRTHLRLRDRLHLPFSVDNLSFAPSSTSAAVSANRDPFSAHLLLAAGHPHPLSLLRTARGPFPSPSWVTTLSPSTAQLTGQDRFHLSALRANLAHDRAAPVHASRRVLTHNPHWKIRSLLQSLGGVVEILDYEKEGAMESRKVGLPSSSTAVWDGDVGDGTLVVTGLYATGILACQGVGRE